MSAAKVCRDQQRTRQKKLKSKICHSYYGFLFISNVRFVSIPTPYLVATSALQGSVVDPNLFLSDPDSALALFWIHRICIKKYYTLPYVSSRL
jgi:hypothetical protein